MNQPYISNWKNGRPPCSMCICTVNKYAQGYKRPALPRLRFRQPARSSGEESISLSRTRPSWQRFDELLKQGVKLLRRVVKLCQLVDVTAERERGRGREVAWWRNPKFLCSSIYVCALGIHSQCFNGLGHPI
jgi:hypothetical protein